MTTQEHTTNVQAIIDLLALWHQTKQWAEDLICDHFELEEASNLLTLSNQQRDKPLGQWTFRVHGFGVDVTSLNNKGGIDFDFHRSFPSEWDLRGFMVKQYNAGNLQKKVFRPFIQDRDRFCSVFSFYIATVEDGESPEVLQQKLLCIVSKIAGPKRS